MIHFDLFLKYSPSRLPQSGPRKPILAAYSTRKVIMSLLLCLIAQKSTPSQASFQLQFHPNPFAGANGKRAISSITRRGKAIIFATGSFTSADLWPREDRCSFATGSPSSISSHYCFIHLNLVFCVIPGTKFPITHAITHVTFHFRSIYYICIVQNEILSFVFHFVRDEVAQ